jgi:hypothetical protein
VLVVPLLFYLLVVRRHAWSPWTVLPVFLLSVWGLSQVLPAGHDAPLAYVRGIAVTAELGLLGSIAVRARRALRAGRGKAGDPLERMRSAAFELLRNETAAEILSSELALFHFALGAWRTRPYAPATSSAFSQNRRNAHGAIAGALLLAILIEGVAVHVLVARVSSPVAWLLTATTVYAALWLIADYRATVLQPILLDSERLSIRAGLRLRLDVPRARITAVQTERPGLARPCVAATFLVAPTTWIVFDEAIVARAAFGLHRRVRAIGLAVDDPHALREALAAGSTPP